MVSLNENERLDLRTVSDSHAVILFDGVCNLCNSIVNFIIDRDPNIYFQFVALQSDLGQQIQNQFLKPIDPSSTFATLLLYEQGQLYERSTAVLRIARKLRGGWKLIYVCILIPKPIRDFLYQWIAQHRYRWFGKSDTCRMRSIEDNHRFLH